MRILEVREKTYPIASPIRNAYIDFSKMTLSLVAVVTDAVRDGRRVVGYGFNSNGRYGQGALMRERFIPRLMEAKEAARLIAGRLPRRPRRIVYPRVLALATRGLANLPDVVRDAIAKRSR